MCLEIKWHSLRRKAKQDIVVYKIFDKIGGEYLTYCRGFLMQLDKLYESPLKRCYNGNSEMYGGQSRHTIEQGFHSIATCKEAYACMSVYRRPVVKCIIPKGSYYYKGLWRGNNATVKSYASSSIKLIEVYD